MKEIFIKLAEILPALQEKLGVATIKLYKDYITINFYVRGVLNSIPEVEDAEVALAATGDSTIHIWYTIDIE